MVGNDDFDGGIFGRCFDLKHMGIVNCSERRGACRQHIVTNESIERIAGPCALDRELLFPFAHLNIPTIIPIVDVDEQAVACRFYAKLLGHVIQVVNTELILLNGIAVGLELAVKLLASHAQNAISSR